MEGEDITLQLLIIAPDAAIGVGKGKKSVHIAALSTLILLFEQIFHDLVFQKGDLLLACNAEVRRDVGRVNMRLNQTLAEGVKGRNVCSCEQDALAFESADALMKVGCGAAAHSQCGNLLVERRLDALPHL